ncbi:Uncharacterised protein [Chlamydia trachomatis]|nr:Uncharacterised protein [Chlamydia trachomatis]
MINAVFFDNTKTFGNGFCRILMVTSNHDWTNASFLSYFNSLCCFRTFRVNHTYQTREDKISLNNFCFQCWKSIRIFVSHHQDTKGLFSKTLIGVKNSLFISVSNRTNLPIFFNLGHTLQQLVWRTFNSDEIFAISLFMNG